MDTSSINREYIKYIPLLLEVITESPIRKGDDLIPHEEVVALLEADIKAIYANIGLCGKRFYSGVYSHSVNLMFEVMYKSL